jgi:hypothetical protein
VAGAAANVIMALATSTDVRVRFIKSTSWNLWFIGHALAYPSRLH